MVGTQATQAQPAAIPTATAEIPAALRANPFAGADAREVDLEMLLDAMHAMRVGDFSVRLPRDLEGIGGLILPGGESTTMSHLLGTSGVRAPLAERLRDGLPVLGTCAGMILLATEVADARSLEFTAAVPVVEQTPTVYSMMLADSVLGVGVRAGAPKPDVSTVEAFRRTMVGARAVAYSKAGASGIYFTGRC